MKTPEAHPKDQIKEWLTEIGAYQFWPVNMGYGKRTVDCLACIRGQFFAIEVKRLDGKPRKFQKEILKEVKEAQGFALSVDNLEDLKGRVAELASYCL